MNILVVQGHPDAESFTRANALNYYKEAKSKGFKVDIIDLSINNFDPVLRFGYRKHIDDESLPKKVQKLIKSADHIAFFFPIWWSTEPSVLNGLISRTLTPGFAYQYNGDHVLPKKLLNDKTADLYMTCRAPGIFYKLPGKIISKWKHEILGFCGIKVKNVHIMGRMNSNKDTNQRRQHYIYVCSNTLNNI